MSVNGTKTVRLLDVEPDLGRYLNDEDRLALDGLPVPVVSVAPGELDVQALLGAHHAFATILLDGMLVRRIVMGESATLRLVGPGEFVGTPATSGSLLITRTGWRAAAPTRLAILGREVLLATHRAPRLVAGLQARSTEQSDRVALQLAICQLPRVEDRVLCMLWLLAESWGQVTSHGTALRLHLTHETIGGLVGARRSTVTLALGQLAEAGTILRQDRGWLLLEPPPVFASAPPVELGPELLPDVDLPVPAPATLVSDVTARVAELREVRSELEQVRAQIQRRVEQDLERLRETRERSLELREQARAQRAAGRSRFPRVHHDDDAADALGSTHGQQDDPAAERPPAAIDGVEH
jgi:CRP/FNR family cyclic AMP-dependent transcriptional regulator